MDRIEQCRSNAEWYLMMASRAESEVWRSQLTQIARHWFELVAEYKKTLGPDEEYRTELPN